MRFPDEERRGHAGLKFNDSRDSGYKGLLLPSLLVEDVFSVLPRNPIIFHTRRCKSWTYPRRGAGTYVHSHAGGGSPGTYPFTHTLSIQSGNICPFSAKPDKNTTHVYKTTQMYTTSPSR